MPGLVLLKRQSSYCSIIQVGYRKGRGESNASSDALEEAE